MNFLAHAWLARRGSDEFLYGNLIADGVKGSDLGAWSQAVASGIRHHRRVDSWVDAHPRVLAAKQRAPRGQRRYAGIALDLVWDHFLARQQAGSAVNEALIERSYQLLSAWPAPNRLASMMPVLVERDWLRGYASFEFTCRAIAGVGERLSGPNRLAQLVPWLHGDYRLLEDDFQVIWADGLAALAVSPAAAR